MGLGNILGKCVWGINGKWVFEMCLGNSLGNSLRNGFKMCLGNGLGNKFWKWFG